MGGFIDLDRQETAACGHGYDEWRLRSFCWRCPAAYADISGTSGVLEGDDILVWRV